MQLVSGKRENRSDIIARDRFISDTKLKQTKTFALYQGTLWVSSLPSGLTFYLFTYLFFYNSVKIKKKKEINLERF